MKKYIEKAIKKGLIIRGKKAKGRVDECKKLNTFAFFSEEKRVYPMYFDGDSVKLIKAVFKSLFGEEEIETDLYHCKRAWEAWHFGTMEENDFEKYTVYNYKHHLEEWITSDLRPEDYLDKYYKE